MSASCSVAALNCERQDAVHRLRGVRQRDDQPTCQPVTLKVLPALDTVMVRSHMPGSPAKCTWVSGPSLSRGSGAASGSAIHFGSKRMYL